MYIVDYHNKREFKLPRKDPSIKAEKSEMEMKSGSLSDFSKVKIGMTVDEVVELVGEPMDDRIFSLPRSLYIIDEGWQMKLFVDSKDLISVLSSMRIIDYSNNRAFQLQQKKSTVKAKEPEMEMKLCSLSSFSKVKIGMKYDEVVKLAGKPIVWEDSGITWYLYKIDEGWYIKLFFDSNNTLFDMHIVDYPNEREFKLAWKYNEIEVTVKSPLTEDKVRIEFDTNMNTISRKTDKDIFNRRKKEYVLYDARGRSVIYNTYRENDFLITYDNKYYFSFRHLKTNLQYHYQYQYDYYFNFYTKNNSIFVEVNININGKNRIKFKKPMLEISLADKYRSNVQVDDTRMIYDMTELIDPKK
jgi:outer membrane protein assembly factor BamE (lipoprotein component of BamABCDE complex)